MIVTPSMPEYAEINASTNDACQIYQNDKFIVIELPGTSKKDTETFDNKTHCMFIINKMTSQKLKVTIAVETHLSRKVKFLS